MHHTMYTYQSDNTLAAIALQKHADNARVSDGTTWEAHKALMLAMAMQESDHMDVHQRDFTKDNNTDKSANCSIFNLSVVSEPVMSFAIVMVILLLAGGPALEG